MHQNPLNRNPFKTLGIATLLLLADERDIRRAARLLQAYEKDFWFTVGEN